MAERDDTDELQATLDRGDPAGRGTFFITRTLRLPDDSKLADATIYHTCDPAFEILPDVKNVLISHVQFTYVGELDPVPETTSLYIQYAGKGRAIETIRDCLAGWR